MVNDVSVSSGISSREQVVNSIQNNLLDGALCKNVFIPIFSLFFWFSNVILSDALILPVSHLQTQQVMTLQIRSHIEYLIQIYYILVLIL